MPVYRHASGNGVWYVDYTCPVTGKRRRRSAETTEKSVALEKQRAWVTGLDWKAPPAAGKEPGTQGYTLEQAFDACTKTIWSPLEASSQDTIKSNSKILSAMVIEIDGKPVRLGGMPVAKITFTVLELVKRELVSKGYAATTVNRKMHHIGAALSCCTEWEDSKGVKLLAAKPRTPTAKVENENRERVLTEAEEALVFDAIDAREVRQPTNAWAHYRALIRVLLDSGMRRGEAVQVRASQFTQDEDGDWQIDLLGKQTKNGKPRTIPCTAAVAALIPWLQANSLPDGRVFPFSGENAWYRWDCLREDIAKAHKKVDLSDAVIHSLRHTCLTRMSNRGVPIEVLCEIAGHHSITITAKYYVHIASKRKKDAIKTLTRPRLVVSNARVA